MSNNDDIIYHGPPGTGLTTTKAARLYAKLIGDGTTEDDNE